MAKQSVNIVSGKTIIVGNDASKRKYVYADNPVSIDAHEAKKLIKRGIVTAA